MKIKTTLTTSHTLFNKEDQKRLNQIVQQLLDSPDSAEFRQPVDYRSLGLHDYINIVKTPMDLGTVNTKLNSGEYKTVEECLEDIQIIWDNCKLYNGAQSWITKLADKLERSFKKYVKNYLPLVSLPSVPKPNNGATQPEVYHEDPQEQISYNDKVEFANNLKQLQPDQIGLIVHMIQNTCPNAFVEVDTDKFQIIVDSIELEAFIKCQKQIESWLFGDELVKKARI